MVLDHGAHADRGAPGDGVVEVALAVDELLEGGFAGGAVGDAWRQAQGFVDYGPEIRDSLQLRPFRVFEICPTVSDLTQAV